MVRKFLYAVAILLVLIIGAAFALRIWSDDLAEVAFVPTERFVEQDPLEQNAYRDTAMWISHPQLPQANDPAAAPRLRGARAPDPPRVVRDVSGGPSAPIARYPSGA